MSAKPFRFLRRSPRIKKNEENKVSTSIQDMNLCGAETFCETVHKPKIKSCRSQNEMNVSERSLKRMRSSNLSLASFEGVMPTPMKRLKPSTSSTTSRNLQEDKENQKAPRKKFSTRVAALAKGFSPGSLKKNGFPVQRSSSLNLPNSANQNIPTHFTFKKYKQCTTPTRRRSSKLWVESLERDVRDWTPQQIRRQEAIYELCCGEIDLVEDLKLLQEAYFNPVSKLKLLENNDLMSIFGSIQALIPLHEDLLRRINEVKNEDGSIYGIGVVLMEWIPTLQPYISYCANQLQTKETLLDKIRENKQFADFLQRCQESPFSRKLDLWSFLDSPRSKLVKYPLLFSNIHRYTPKDDPDRAILYRSIKQIEGIIKEADKTTGVSKCIFYKERLTFFDNNECKSQFDEAQTLVCHGCLKTKSGTKVEAFLFDTVFLCSRLITRNGVKNYHVFLQPIPVVDLEVTDLNDGEHRLGGSFRTTLTKNSTAKHAIRVSMKDLRKSKSVILQANDQHDKKQWLNSFQSLLKEKNNVEVKSSYSDLVDRINISCSSEL
ncbi:rho guanine nucleotide exchange factor 3 isoform X5 [Hydra vulgaris]|uniref:Rho guanine nucleotide exchange factor 3 isoform X5 n=1 Tax=Hydra vulgaris TaxID=6087 RepID=A0ABM4D8M7_HYDVU